MEIRPGTIGVIARSGYAARGVVYLIIGGLAVLAAFGDGDGKTVGSKGALATLAGNWWGWFALIAIALGLFGYTVWRGVQAIFDADNHGTDVKAVVIRGALMVSAITHFLLGLYALTLPFAVGGSAGGSGSEGAVSWLLQQPFGIYLLAAVGLSVVGAGIAQIWKGVSGKYRERLVIPRHLMNTLSPVCAFGLSTRGLVFAIMGGFMIYAAYRYDPAQAGGLAEALHWLRAQDYGQFLFLAVAIGLLSFGGYSLIESAFRKIETDPEFSVVGNVTGLKSS